jgi:acyl-coenzyme A synthetase/AMP-(fatty) acid ligase
MGATPFTDDANLTAPLRDAARAHPDAIAVIDAQSAGGAPGRAHTHAQLDRILDAVAHRARALGLAPGDLVTIGKPPHWRELLLKLGLARAGVASCAVQARGSAGRVVARAEEARGDAGALLFEDTSWHDAGDAPPAAMAPGGDSLFVLQATSGTTGVGKLVPVTQAMMATRVRMASTDWLPTELRVLCTGGPGGLYPLRHILATFARGGMVVLADSTDDVASLIDRHRITLLVSSPYAIGALLQRRAPDAPPFATLELLEASGSLLSIEFVRRVSARLCARVRCTYGATETGMTASGEASALRGLDGAGGIVLPGADVEAVDDDDRPLPAGRSGRLRARVPGQASSYFDDPETSARAFRDGWFYPGDLGYVTPDRILVVEGRIDELINVGGSKLAPAVFERVLLSVPGIVDAAVFGVRDAMGRQVPHAAIVAPVAVEIAAIEAAFRAHPRVPPPVVVMRMPTLPRDAQGKVRRRELAELAGRHAARASGSAS